MIRKLSYVYVLVHSGLVTGVSWPGGQERPWPAAYELKKGKKLASLNVNGLRSHLDEIELLIRSLDIHVLTLDETKLDSH